MKNKPLLICMTPVRNEAWVLHAFLKATSLWADYIIIADQMSIDGSRDIALSYPKVILIENNNPDFNESERQKLLIDKAREIKGDKILFGLDADEIFSANYFLTDDWKRIINSKPRDVFWLKWANIASNKNEYWQSDTYFPWVFHDDGIEPHGNYVRNMHSMRIPYPIEETQMYYIDDFRVLHLAYLNEFRVNAKKRFYKFVDWELNKRSIIKLSRSYSFIIKNVQREILPINFIYKKDKFEFNLFDEILTETTRFWFDEYIADRINNYPVNQISKLDIWDNVFMHEFNFHDPRKFGIKLIHKYLSITNPISKILIVRFIDRILIKFGF